MSPGRRPAPPAEEQIRRVLDSIRKVVRILRVASRDAEKRIGLSSAQLFVLQRVAEGPGLSVNEVAAATHTHQSSVSVVVQRLVDRRLVSRKRSTTDARQILLTATAAGRAQVRAAPELAQDRIIDALRRLPPVEIGRLAGSLHALLDQLGVDRDAPAVMLFEEEGDPPRPKTRRLYTPAQKKVRAHGRSRTRS